MSARRILLSNLGLIALLIVGSGYLLLGVTRIDPTTSPYTVTIRLAESGGLLDYSDVTYRGSRIGQVADIRLRRGGVAVDVRIDEGVRVPKNSEVVVANLSPAGEQYLDFRPRTDQGPFLAAGMVLNRPNARTPPQFADLMGHIGDLADQVQPDKLDLILTELAAASEGTGPELRQIVNDGQTVLSGLEKVLPETVRALKNSATTLRTAHDLRDELTTLSTRGKVLGKQLRESDPTIRTLLDRAPEGLRLTESLLREKRPVLRYMLADAVRLNEVVSPRAPAIAEVLPRLTRLGDALEGVVHNGVLTTLADIWPRPSCDYGTPRRSPTIGGSPPPPLDKHCPVEGPTIQQRGSYNVPRPDSGNGEGRSGDEGPNGAARQGPAGPRPGSGGGGQDSWFENYVSSLTE